MTDPDRAATRRDITAALEAAFERRHQVLDEIVEAEDRDAAIASISTLLSVPAIGAEAVLGMAFDRLTVSARRANAAELEDLNSKLTFTQTERTEDVGAAGDGSGSPASRLLTCKRATNTKTRHIFAARLRICGAFLGAVNGSCGNVLTTTHHFRALGGS